MLIGGLEAGGTKMVCVVGDEQGQIHKRIVIPTKSPEETLSKMILFYQQQKIEALGIGCFGPVELNVHSDDYGMIRNTTKVMWRNIRIVDKFRHALSVPVAIDTDVNAAAYGEAMMGAGVHQEVVLYVTIGTGVGVGVCINGEPLHGMIHPEGGHIMLQRWKEDPIEGICSFHKNCAEGLASGPAHNKRLSLWKENQSDFSIVWDIEADYIAQAIANFILVYSPNKVVLWGGVMHEEQLFQKVRIRTLEKLNGYLQHDKLKIDLMNDYIVPPALGEDAGAIGSILLGKKAFFEKNN